MKSDKKNILSTWQFILLHCAFWFGMIILAKPNLDRYGDMIEVFAWSQHWLLGSDKHPQFLPWMAKIWFMIAPRSVASFFALSAVNLAIALFGIAALARSLKFKARDITLAIALCVLAFPYLTLADKLNMNAICLSTWPWLCWAFIKTANTKGLLQVFYSSLLGSLAVIAILSKYYSIVVLLALFVLSITPAYRALYRTPAPYVFALFSCLFISPHIIWLIQNDFPSLRYAEAQGGGGVSWKYIIRFTFAPIAYWIIPVSVSLAVLYKGNLLERIKCLCSWQNSSDAIWYFCVMPIVVTLLFGILGIVQLSTPWIIPLGFAFTLLMVRNADQEKLEIFSATLIGNFKFIWPFLLIAGLSFTLVNAAIQQKWHQVPEQLSMKEIEAAWKKTSPDQQPMWVAKRYEAARFAYFSNFPKKVEALINFPDELPQYYPPLVGWKKMPGLIICPLVTSINADRSCIEDGLKWAKKHDLNATLNTISIEQKDWRHWVASPYEISAIFIKPSS